MLHFEEKFGLFIAVGAAGLIASHDFSSAASEYFLLGYAYWLVRLLAESAFFFGMRAALEHYWGKSHSIVLITVISILLSHIPFVLSVTALDIILGQPELGLTQVADVNNSRIEAFGLELIYLLDNHVWLCLLLTLPRLFQLSYSQNVTDITEHQSPTLLSTIDPPLKGIIVWVEAQEHYVRIVTDQEQRTVLARFSDIVRELAKSGGLQVHRSHWIKKSAVKAHEKKGQNLFVKLTTGDEVPVSRTYRHLFED